MPELPEVELVVRNLARLLKGRSFITAELRRERLAPSTSPDDFAANLKETAINFIHRRGKHILFDLENGRTLLTHLRMSGRFIVIASDDAEPKFTHAVFVLDDGSRLVFDDQRHFGLMKVIETADLFQSPELAKLAPEPFSDEFSVAYLRKVMKASKKPVKEFLLDQTKVCGVGNIYASEALFIANINPQTLANAVSPQKASKLHAAIKAVLDEAISYGEATARITSDAGDGVYGNDAATDWRVYDREGDPCRRCSRQIVRIKQGARSTYYCPKCQK